MGACDVVSGVIISKELFWDCGGFRDIRWFFNWSAVFVETVFNQNKTSRQSKNIFLLLITPLTISPFLLEQEHNGTIMALARTHKV